VTARLRLAVGDLTGPLVVLAALITTFAVLAPGFATADNLANVGRTASIVALAACGQAIVIITRGLDLSSGSVVALMSVIAVKALGDGAAVAYALAIAVALAAGLANGVLVGRFAIPPFLVTLGMLTTLHGLASYLVGGIPLQAAPSAAFVWPATADVGPVPVAVVIAAVGLGGLSLLLHRTTLGRSWYLIGANPDAARMAGLRTARLVCAAYVVGAAFVAAAGVILCARVHSAQPNLQPTLPFEAIAACAIGGLALSGGVGRVRGVVVGVFVMAVCDNGLVLLNVSDDVQTMVIGAVTVAAVLVRRPLPALGVARVRRARGVRAASAPAARSEIVS